MKRTIRNLAALGVMLVLCASMALGFARMEAGFAKETPVRIKNFDDIPVNTLSVYDVDGVMKMTAVNYLPDDFAELGETVSGADNGANPVRRGTYRFVVDTLSGEEWNDTDKLKPLLKADGKWHLTMYIPPVFTACCVYVQHQNKNYVGTIDRYNVDYYTSFSAPSEYDDSVTHTTATEPLFVDIPLSPETKYSRECTVTIHYESDNDNFVGIDGVLIGEDSAVRQIASESRSLLLAGTLIAAATLLLFLFICVLKHSLTFGPQLLFAASICAALLATYMLFGHTSAPYFWLALRGFAVGLVVAASTMYLPRKLGKVPLAYAAFIFAFAASVPAFVVPYCTSVAAHNALNTIYTVAVIVCCAVVTVFTVWDVAKGKAVGLRLNNIAAVVLAIVMLFVGQKITFVGLNSAFWLCLTMLAITIVLGFREFTVAEIRNRYLTTNLEQEVAAQTQSLQTLIAERDKILLYVSHDMKKTVIGMGGALTDLRQSLTAPELTAKVDTLLQRNNELTKDFADLGKYGKQNYVAEQSEVLDVCLTIRKVTDDLRPDCEANGILLAVNLPDRLDVYAKRIALESVILNLVLNAIEHACCTKLTVNVAKHHDMCRIEIIDNGVGVTTDKNIFEPFVSGDNRQNNSGLGLFLARTAIESMHGELTYERRDNETIFSATLPLA